MNNTNTVIKDKKLAEVAGKLAGLTLYLSDNISVKGEQSTSGSRFLENYKAPYNAHLVEILLAAGADIRVFPCETEFPVGGLIYCGDRADLRYYLKTSYGLVDRFGLTAVTPSLETIDIAASSLEEITRIMDVFLQISRSDLATGIRSPQQDQISLTNLSVSSLTSQIYEIIVAAETATSLARIDGIRYGNRIDPGTGFDDLYTASRDAGFGADVKKRIVIGNYIVSSTFSGPLYEKAMQVRSEIEHSLSLELEGAVGASGTSSSATQKLLQENPLLIAQVSRLPLLLHIDAPLKEASPTSVPHLAISAAFNAQAKSARLGTLGRDLQLLQNAISMEAHS